MADVKYNKKHVFGENDFRVTTGDADYPERYFGLQHDTLNALDIIGEGSIVTNHLDPIVLADDGYFDLPADSAGHGFFFLGDMDGYAEIIWDSSNVVTLITNTSNVQNSELDGYFCFFDNTTSVRVKNRTGTAIRVVFEYEYTDTVVAPTFKMLHTPSGVDNLEASLTINGTTVTPKFRYRGGDASASGWDGWGYGASLTKGGAGTPVYNAGSPLLGSSDDSVEFDGVSHFGNDTAVNQFTSGDICFEMIIKASASALYIFSTYGTAGLVVYTNASGDIVLYIDNGSTSQNITTTPLTEDVWYHVMGFINRDENSANGSQLYVNGIADGSGANFSSVSGDLTSTKFYVASTIAGGSHFDKNIAYLAAWESASWFKSGTNGPKEWAAIVMDRFIRMRGLYPEIAAADKDIIVDGDMEAVGTGDWTAIDSTLSKDSTAPLYEGTQHLRVTSTNDTFYARQTLLTAGNWYRVRGAARSVTAGDALPLILEGGAVQVWVGTNSTSWQEFDVVFQNSTGTDIFFGSGGTHPGTVDFDDITLELLHYYPTVATRAFTGYLDKVEGDYRKLYRIGGEWLRICHQIDSNAYSFKGLLSETQRTNVFNYSEDFSTGWAFYDAGDAVNLNAVVCPDGRTAATEFIADNTDGRHELRKSVTLTVDTYTYSVFIKKGSATWIEIALTSIGNVYGYYNLETNTVGTIGSSSDFYVEGPFYNDFYRLCLVFTGTAAAHTLIIRVIDADLGLNFSGGDGSTVNYIVWGAQAEIGDYASSYIPTIGSTQSRLKDQLMYVAGDNIGGEDVGTGTLVADVLFPNFASADYKGIIAISDGLASADRVCILANNTTGYSRALTAASGGNAGASIQSVDITDGVKHEIRGTWAQDYVTISTDGVLWGTPDTSADMPDDLDSLEIGSLQNSSLQEDGLISKIRIYATPTDKG